jgi:hypothetical protein
MRAHPAHDIDRHGVRPRVSATLIDPAYARLVGGAAWARLPARLRARFSARLGRGEAKVYAGQIEYTRLSRMGWLLAQALRTLGAPLPLFRSEGGEAAIVSVTDDPNAAGQIWSRQYDRAPRGRALRFPQIVASAKRFQGPTGCEEWVHPCIGMRLRVTAGPDRLRFEGVSYRINLFGLEGALPQILSPGCLVVEHIDLGAGMFRFTLRLTHPVFGTLLDQSVLFSDPEGLE